MFLTERLFVKKSVSKVEGLISTRHAMLNVKRIIQMRTQ